jgi:hypothetical protein
MYPSLMNAERAIARQHELIAEAADRRLAREARQARRAERAERAERRQGATRSVRRSWLRSATQPAHS